MPQLPQPVRGRPIAAHRGVHRAAKNEAPVKASAPRGKRRRDPDPSASGNSPTYDNVPRQASDASEN